MNRKFVGIVASVAVSAAGSVGTYFGWQWMGSGTPAAEDPTAFVAARDIAPRPIPLPADTGNPFSQGAQSSPANVLDDDPYVDPIATSAPRTNTLRVQHQQPVDDFPSAGSPWDPAPEEPLVRSELPPTSRNRAAAPAASVPDQPGTAGFSLPDSLDLPDYDPLPAQPEPAQPQPLRAAPQNANFDRFGRPMDEPKMPVSAAPPYADDRMASPTPVTRPQAMPDPAGDAWSRGAGWQGDSDEGTGRPGDARLSGTQSPMLTIEKLAPAEIQIGRAARFAIKVRNAGSVTAQGVEIHDLIPQGTQLIETSPAAKRGPQGELVWELGTLRPGEEQQAELQLMPMAEGEVGSVATVHFRAEASVRTVATKPMLKMDVSAPAKVMKGEQLNLRIRLTNPGSGAATGITLSEEVPAGLRHPAGNELELDIGTLRPGETRELDLQLRAAEAGPVTNIIHARGDANLQVQVASELEIVAPQLQVSMTGPKRRYLERKATHNISLANPGTAAAKDIELMVVLPRELKFVEANNGGVFDAATNSVYWSLEELPAREVATALLTTMPLRPGDAKLTIKSRAQSGLADQRDEVVSIEGMAAINFQLSDLNDPIEEGGQTSYEIRVTNQGSKAASNVRVVALLPREMQAVGADGPVRYAIEGQRVVFEPLKQLAPKADTAYTVKVKAVQSGDLRLQVQIVTDEIREPITKEESTRVFGDE